VFRIPARISAKPNHSIQYNYLRQSITLMMESCISAHERSTVNFMTTEVRSADHNGRVVKEATGIEGSDFFQGVDACSSFFLFVLPCASRGLAMGTSPNAGTLPIAYKIHSYRSFSEM
jgi:hypothetical protein